MAKAAAKNPIEVKIGVQYSPTDVRGRQVIVPAAQCSYIEIGPPESRRVGFGTD
ncbi:MAG: DUF3107 domain-containing protein [Candidatus Nanopelagicales bacterium]|nr:DUF3107 domain-containing protein [Candidatus Nanopelagicales bacterium]